MSQSKPQPTKQPRRTKTAQRAGPKTSRSEQSRQRIIDAVVTLIDRGQFRFGALDVAKEAQLGLRTVFNHFEDMDSLFREMESQIHNKNLPILLKPLEAKNWKERVLESAERRGELCEIGFSAGQFARSMQLYSPALQEAVERSAALERSAVEAIIPKDLEGREALVIALDVAFCFESWVRLREQSGLSVEDAVASMKETASALLSHHAGSATSPAA